MLPGDLAGKDGNRGGRGGGGGGGEGPEMDEALDGEVRDKVGGREGQHRCPTHGVSEFEPPLDGGAVVGYSGAQAHR